MKMTEATRTEMAPLFGVILTRGKPADLEARDYLERTLAGFAYQRDLKIQACLAPELVTTGIKRIDKMLAADFADGFITGNVSSNMQSSSILPAFNQCKVNGFTVIDGKTLQPGDLQANAFKTFLQSGWNDQIDLDALQGVQETLKLVQPDRQTTLYRIMHTRTKETRYNQASPVHTHGWLLIDDHQELRFEQRIGTSAVGHQLFERAKQVLTCQHSDPKLMLEIKQGRIIFVDPEVLKMYQAIDRDATLKEIMTFEIPTPSWASTDDTIDDQRSAEAINSPG